MDTKLLEVDGVAVLLDDVDEGDGVSVDTIAAQRHASAVAAAESLIRRDIPKIVLSYQGDDYLLFDCNKYGESSEAGSIICKDMNAINMSFNDLVKQIRAFLEQTYGKLVLVAKEITIEIHCLDLTLFEDNVFNNQISFADIATIFKILKDRSEKQQEQGIPSFMECRIVLRPRFVSRYNALVELADSTATFKNIPPFTNDKSHPVVLDETGNTEVPEKVVVMDLEEDQETNCEARSNSLSPADSDELLEIVDEDMGEPSEAVSGTD